MPEHDSSLRLRQCRRCGLWKPARLPEFDRDYKRADRLNVACADCRRLRRREEAAANREAVRRQKREYDRSHPDVGRKATARWRAQNPDRVRLLMRAGQRMKAAIRRGQVVRPATCVVCGGVPVQAAYGDHQRPIETVRWLCRPCTRIWTPEQRAAWSALIPKGD